MPQVKMPQLGESVTEGTIGKWLKAKGDQVVKYEPIAEVVTDKVTAEIPSDFDGVMGDIFIGEGETVKVGTVLCNIETAGDSALAVAGVASAGQTPEPPQGSVTASNASTPATTDSGERVPAQHAASGGGRFSPAVLKLAEEHGVNLQSVQGTGEGGRITRKDVLQYVASGAKAPSRSETTTENLDSRGTSAPAQVSRTASSEPARESVYIPLADEEVIEPSPIRKTIAKRMVESKRNAPHAWTMVEADVSKLVQFRASVKNDFKRKEGIDLTYLPFFIKAVAESLKKFPILNASWIDDKIVMKHHINISIAVATDDSLVVPVIHDADRLSVAGIAHKVNELAAKARSGKLGMTDVQGGTFTVNNTGAFGSIQSQPILNAPQAAILSVESIVKRPVVVEGDAIAVRSMVNLCMSLDHRLLDGWVAGQFLKAVRTRLEAFGQDTVIY